MQRTILLLAVSVVIVAVLAPLLLCVHAVFLSEVRWLPEPTLARGWRTPEEAVRQTLTSGRGAG